jgi:hypothetical protein
MKHVMIDIESFGPKSRLPIVLLRRLYLTTHDGVDASSTSHRQH